LKPKQFLGFFFQNPSHFQTDLLNYESLVTLLTLIKFKNILDRIYWDQKLPRKFDPPLFLYSSKIRYVAKNLPFSILGPSNPFGSSVISLLYGAHKTLWTLKIFLRYVESDCFEKKTSRLPKKQKLKRVSLFVQLFCFDKMNNFF
jgi:hypothetical protein